MKKLIAVLGAAFLCSISLLGQSPTPNLQLTLPNFAAPNWNIGVNSNFSAIDNAVGLLQAPFNNAWTSTTVYAKGAEVSFSNALWISKVNANFNNTPQAGSSAWQFYTNLFTPPAFGTGAPALACTTANEGQIYYNTSGSNLVVYTCHGGAWGAAGGGAVLPSSGIVKATSPTTAVAATSTDIAGLFGGSGPCFLNSIGGCSTPSGSVPAVGTGNAAVGTGTGITDAGQPPVLANQPPNVSNTMVGGSIGGSPSNIVNFDILGPSYVSNVIPSLLSGVADETAPGKAFAGALATKGTYYVADSSSNVQYFVPNQDGRFVVGQTVSMAGNSPGGLGDGPYLLTATTPTSITFNSITSNGGISNTSGTAANLVTDLVNKFGCSGCQANTILTGTNPWNYSGLLTTIAAQRTAGHSVIPTIWGLSANDTRQAVSTGTTAAQVSTLKSTFAAINRQFPGIQMVLMESPPIQQSSTVGGGNLYACMEGYVHNATCTVNPTTLPVTAGTATIAAASTNTAPVTSITVTVSGATATAAITAANAYTAGTQVYITGCSTATWLNSFNYLHRTIAQTYSVSATGLGGTGFQVALNDYQAAGTTADTRTAAAVNTVTLTTFPESLWFGDPEPMTVFFPDGSTSYQVVLDSPAPIISQCQVNGSNVAIFTGANTFSVGNTFTIPASGFGAFASGNCSALNGQNLTVISTGLTATQFEANFTHAAIALTGDYGTAFTSGVTEVVNLLGMSSSGGNAQLIFSNTNAHTSPFNVTTTAATMAQNMTSSTHYAFEAMRGAFNNLTLFPLQDGFMGRLAPVCCSVWYADQIHPANIAQVIMRQLLETVAPLVNAAPKATNQTGTYGDNMPPLQTGFSQGSFAPQTYRPVSWDPKFIPQLAANARVSALTSGSSYQPWTVPTGYFLGCEDPLFYKPIVIGNSSVPNNTSIHLFVNWPENSTIIPAYTFTPGDILNWVGHGCFQPASITAAANGNNNINLTVPSNPWNGLMNQTQGNMVAVLRPLMADPQYSPPFYYDPAYTQMGGQPAGTIIGTTAGTPSTFTIQYFTTLKGQQAASASMGNADVIVVQGVGATKLASTVTCAPAGGNTVASTSQVTCSDSAGTSYSTWTNGSIVDIYYPSRGSDQSVSSLQIQPLTSPTNNTNLPANSGPFDLIAKAPNNSASLTDIIRQQSICVAGAANPICYWTATHPEGSTGGAAFDFSALKPSRLPIVSGVIGTAIASAATIAPTSPVVHVTGTTTINTITPPAGCSTSGFYCQVTLWPDGLWSTGTSGNIAIASTAAVSKALIMTYDPAAAKWAPSY